jgi:drug/metabolite transporter (DMT)-like permease
MEDTEMTHSPARYWWGVALLVVALTIITGAVAYNIGLSQGLAQVAASADAPAPPPYPYYWHRPWGFPLFFPLLFVFWIVLFRGFFWRPWGPWYHGGPPSERFEEWHRRAHERMKANGVS